MPKINNKWDKITDSKIQLGQDEVSFIIGHLRDLCQTIETKGSIESNHFRDITNIEENSPANHHPVAELSKLKDDITLAVKTTKAENQALTHENDALKADIDSIHENVRTEMEGGWESERKQTQLHIYELYSHL
jgi:hypothetical protein